MNFADACQIVAGKSPSPFQEMPERDYHADPCPAPSFSASLGKVILDQSPLHAYLAHPRLGGTKREPTAAMEFGSAVHKLVLGKGADIAVIDADSFHGGGARQERDDARAQGRIPLLKADFDSAVELSSSAQKQIVAKLPPDALAAWSRAQTERVIVRDFANLKGPGRVFARGMIDAVHIDEDQKRAWVFDVKTAAECSLVAITRTISARHYDMQMATYEWLLEDARPDLKGRITCILLFVESSAPYSVVPVDLDFSFRQIGRSKLGRAWDSWCRCIASGVWPSYVDSMVTISPSPWELTRELDTEIEVR